MVIFCRRSGWVRVEKRLEKLSALGEMGSEIKFFYRVGGME